MSDIKCVKLITDQDLIGKVEFDVLGNINITDPAMIVMIPSESSEKMSLGLVPWVQYSEQKTFRLEKSNVLTTFDPVLNVLNNYNRIYGSGIVVAKTLGS